MAFKKIVVVVSSILLLTNLLLSQNLVEAAKKEKERRASLKGKKKVVTTNANLTKSNRKTTTSISGSEVLDRTSPPSTEPSRRMSSQDLQSAPPEQDQEKTFRQKRASLEEKWKKTQEYSDLLSTKINSLWQEFYNLGNDVTSRGKIQQDISETFLKLQRSREEQAQAKKELDAFLEEARKREVPPDWLR